MKRNARFIALLVLLASMLLPASPAEAQVTTATLAGNVADETGGALPGATVTIRALETDITRTLTTDGDGRYRAVGLEPGSYELTVELQGFQTVRRPDIRLSVGQNLTLNVTVAVGRVSDVVTVSGETQLIDTTSSLSAVVDAQQIRELPLNGRDFSQLTLLQPGVLASPTTSRQVDRGMGTQVSVAGARPNQISYQLDGTDVNFQGNGSPGSAAGGLLGVETVREFQVLINNYSAEYGRSSGGIVTAVTRSGTNAVRGAAFGFLRDEKLDSRNYFDDPNADLPPLDRHQAGGYLGGPILREKTFFFGSYEGLRQDRGLTRISRVPSRATRNRGDITPAVRPFLLMFPEPNGEETGASGLYSVTIVEPTRENYFVGKIDHAFSSNQTASLRYSWDKASVTVPQSIPLFSVDTNTKAQFLVGEHKWIVKPSLLNVVKVAWNRAYEATLNVDHIAVDPSLLFIPGTQFGSLTVSGLTTLGTDTNTPTFIDLKSLQVVQSLTWSRGAHSIKSGVNWTRWYNDQNSSFTFGGSYRFNSIENFVRNITNTFEGQAPGSTTDRQWRQNLIGIFLQDDWQVRRTLTLNGGVRYEFITIPTEKEGRAASMPDLYATSPTTGRPLFANPSLGNVAPRLGFAWDITGDGKNSVQGGGGLFYEPILSNVYRAYGNRTPPFYATINPRNPPFPNPTGAGATTALLRLDLLEYELKNPYRIQYNLMYQRQLMAQTVVTAGFIGARGYDQIRNIEWNHAVPQVLADGRYFFPENPVRRNPNFESMRLRITDGRSWYKALVLGASRRFSNNLALQGSYTWGKSEDYGSQAVGSGDFDNSFQPAYGHDPASNKGLSDYDIRHNFVFNYTWEVPVAKNATGVAAALAQGWQFSGIVVLRSGVPFSPQLGFDRARALPRSGGAGQRPNLAPGASLNPVLGGPTRYFDPLAFELPAAGFLGDVPRNTIIGPGYASWDASIVKNFRAGDVRRLQLRVEIFNVLNRANFGLPAATVFDAAGRVPNAGEITTTVGTARQIQLGVKFDF
jgi:outer membrane receptor protein involved in Fe transport